MAQTLHNGRTAYLGTKTNSKKNGYLKKGKKWYKKLNEIFTLRFCVQTSLYDKNYYDVRVGVTVNIPWINEDNTPYGDFYINISVRNGTQVYNDSVEYFNTLTNWRMLRDKMLKLKQWRETYSPEYLRSLPDNEQPSPPVQIPLGEVVIVNYVLSNDFLNRCKDLIG